MPDDKPFEPLISMAELADRLGIATQTLYDWRKHGKGPKGYRLGGRVQFRWSEVEAWLQDQREEPLRGGDRT